MSRDAREAFLADLHVGVLAVASPGGAAPITAPVWYLYEPGGDVIISTGTDSAKARALAAAGRAALCAQREELPYAFVTVEGPVTIGEASQDEREQLATKYLGDLAQSYLDATTDEQTVTVRLTPERWRTQDYAQLPGF